MFSKLIKDIIQTIPRMWVGNIENYQSVYKHSLSHQSYRLKYSFFCYRSGYLMQSKICGCRKKGYDMTE
jgi:hypothetical protein